MSKQILAGEGKTQTKHCPYNPECGHWAYSEMYDRPMCHKMRGACECSRDYYVNLRRKAAEKGRKK